MREILFRGKRKDNGEWIYGYYFQKQNLCAKDGLPISHAISDLPPFGAEIIPETVGQYTGLTDKNGEMIFEGDVIKNADYIGIVEYDDVTATFCVVTYFYEQNIKIPDEKISFDFAYPIILIGNIHDNPELLKGGGQND